MGGARSVNSILQILLDASRPTCCYVCLTFQRGAAAVYLILDGETIADLMPFEEKVERLIQRRSGDHHAYDCGLRFSSFLIPWSNSALVNDVFSR